MTTTVRPILCFVLGFAMAGCSSSTDPLIPGNTGGGGQPGPPGRGSGGSAGSTAGGGSAGTDSGGSSGGGGAAGGGPTDAGPGKTDGPGGVVCGKLVCPSGQVCCNASCGICTPPDGACIQIACDPGPVPGATCKTDADCRLFDDYCTGCDCRSLAKTDPEPKCAGPGVRCLVQPCANKQAACESGRCVVRDGTAGAQRWYPTCGDPVCRAWTAKADVPLCSTQKAGDPCANLAERCDPKNDCNGLLLCATSDPTKAPGGCPISRREFKRDVRYLGLEELRQYQDELLGLRLATWRYKHDPARERLGFMIDDHERSVAVDVPQNMVDLYGYTSLAVATVQLQARELAAMQSELAALKKKIAAMERRDRSRR